MKMVMAQYQTTLYIISIYRLVYGVDAIPVHILVGVEENIQKPESDNYSTLKYLNQSYYVSFESRPLSLQLIH